MQGESGAVALPHGQRPGGGPVGDTLGFGAGEAQPLGTPEGEQATADHLQAGVHQAVLGTGANSTSTIEDPWVTSMTRTRM